MLESTISTNENKIDYYKLALILAYITIFYNLIEGLVSVFLGYEDAALSLFGFGLDSFVEVLSGIGILHMLMRIKNNGNTNPDEFEKTALKITGTSFYILTAGLAVSAVVNFISGHKPETTFWGMIIGLISIGSMWLLIYYKMKTGKALNSKAIIADANCTKACLYLSVVLLASSAGYELTGIGGIDSLGAILIAYFAFKEGRESFEKAKGITCSCGHD